MIGDNCKTAPRSVWLTSDGASIASFPVSINQLMLCILTANTVFYKVYVYTFYNYYVLSNWDKRNLKKKEKNAISIFLKDVRI